MRNEQSSASGGGECATGSAAAKRVSLGQIGKSIRLTKQAGAGEADSSLEAGAGVTGSGTLLLEMTQQAIAAQQPSE